MSGNIIELKWRRDQLWKGCLLASIAHAIMVAHYPNSSNEHSWHGINYNVQDTEGARGTVTFHPQYCIAAFRDDNSDRIAASEYFQETYVYFKNAPKEIVELAETETLQYLLEDVEGKTVPLITTAFWEMNNKLFSADTYENMIKNGGFLLDIHTMDFRAAVEAWKEYYDMSPKQCKLLESIYKRKVDGSADNLILSKDEINLIGTNDPDGLNESKISFEELGIEWGE